MTAQCPDPAACAAEAAELAALGDAEPRSAVEQAQYRDLLSSEPRGLRHEVACGIVTAILGDPMLTDGERMAELRVLLAALDEVRSL